jgi:hypothetical protein
MKQLELFPEKQEYQKVYRSKASGQVYVIRTQSGGICICESYPRTQIEEAIDATYYVFTDDLEELG